MRTILAAGSIAYDLPARPRFVLLVDQIEDTVPDGKTVTRLQHRSTCCAGSPTPCLRSSS